MARIAVTFTVIFLLFAFSHARTPLDLPENDVDTLPESNTKATTILLPSEKPDTEPNTVIDFEPEITDATPLETETILAEPIQEFQQTETETAVDESGPNHPFTFVTFRPTNRHFPHIRGDRQSHPCRHHHRHHHGGERPRFDGDGVREVSYGNDMIIPNEDKVNADPMMLHGDEVRRIPARGFHHHHGRPGFPFRHERWNKDEMKKRPFFHHHHHHHMEEDDEFPERMEHEGGGLMKRIRKFLNHF